MSNITIMAVTIAAALITTNNYSLAPLRSGALFSVWGFIITIGYTLNQPAVPLPQFLARPAEFR